MLKQITSLLIYKINLSKLISYWYILLYSYSKRLVTAMYPQIEQYVKIKPLGIFDILQL